MQERSWNAAGAEQLREAARACLGKWRTTARGELRAVARVLQPTEQVRAVAMGGYEIVRAGAPRRRGFAALIVVTDRRLIFATQRLTFSHGRVEEVAQADLRDATVEVVDGSVERVVIAADSCRITLRHFVGGDAADAIARGVSLPRRVLPGALEGADPSSQQDAPEDRSLPEPALAAGVGPGSKFRVVQREDPDRYELRADSGVVVAWIVRSVGQPARAARARREWRFDIRYVRGGWIGVAEEARSRRELVRYRAGLLPGGTLTLEGHKHRVRRTVSGAWRVTAARQELAVLRHVGGGALELDFGPAAAQVDDPLLLATMLIWLRWLEAGMAGGGGG